MQGDLGCVSLIKSKIGFLNLDKSENRFCVSLQIKTNRLIQDHSDHGASKKPKNPLDMDPFSFFFQSSLKAELMGQVVQSPIKLTQDKPEFLSEFVALP